MRAHRPRFICGACLAVFLPTAPTLADHIWINEFHYDNTGDDVNEFIEVAIRNPNSSGFADSDYAIELYNGADTELYDANAGPFNLGTLLQSGPFPIVGSTDTIALYTLVLPADGLQNGAPDGIALVNITDLSVAQFLSYEGSFTASGSGVAGAAGATSTDVGVAEGSTTLATGSLGATGFGNNANVYSAASYQALLVATPGFPNVGQAFVFIPEPGAILIALCGLCSSLLVARRGR